MVRLMLVLAPVMCILSGIGASSMLLTYMKQIESGKVVDKKSKKFESNYVLRSEVRGNFLLYISLMSVYGRNQFISIYIIDVKLIYWKIN